MTRLPNACCSSLLPCEDHRTVLPYANHRNPVPGFVGIPQDHVPYGGAPINVYGKKMPDKNRDGMPDPTPLHRVNTNRKTHAPKFSVPRTY